MNNNMWGNDRNKYIKQWSAMPLIRKKQASKTVRYHFAPARTEKNLDSSAA